jgi:tetratricopeptide (TPR) repeat protein
MFERYTESARQTISRAKSKASRFGSPEIDAEHILLGLLEDATLAGTTMEGISVPEIREEILSQLPRRREASSLADLPLSAESHEVLALAAEEAGKLPDQYIGNQHILLGLARLGNSQAAQLLMRKGLSADSIRNRLTSQQEESRPTGTRTASASVDKPDLKSVTLRIADLSRLGEHRSALKLLDEQIAGSTQYRNETIRALAPIATAISRTIGELQLVRGYCEQRLAVDPEDPAALYELADCLSLLGETEVAKKYARKSYELSLARGGAQGGGYADLIEQRFPEVKTG